MALSSLAATCMPASLASLALGAAVLQHWAVMAIRAINRKPERRVIFFFMVLDYCGRFVQQMVLYEKACTYRRAASLLVRPLVLSVCSGLGLSFTQQVLQCFVAWESTLVHNFSVDHQGRRFHHIVLHDFHNVFDLADLGIQVQFFYRIAGYLF